MADNRTLKQRIHDSEVKWDCYMRAHCWSERVEKKSIMWWLKEKAAGHEALLERYDAQYRWWHWLLGVKRPQRSNLFRNMLKREESTPETRKDG